MPAIGINAPGDIQGGDFFKLERYSQLLFGALVE